MEEMQSYNKAVHEYIMVLLGHRDPIYTQTSLTWKVLRRFRVFSIYMLLETASTMSMRRNP